MLNNKGNPHTLLFLVVDLAKHTIWLEGKKPQKHNARKELGERFIHQLKDNELYNHSWKGDGGVFYWEAEGRKNYDIVVESADIVYNLFEKWKTDYNELDTQHLYLRISADVDSVFTDDDPSFWTSTKLNRLFKDERTISKRGFAISQQIKEKLTEQKRNRFDYLLTTGPTGQIRFWIDSKHRSKEKDQQ